MKSSWHIPRRAFLRGAGTAIALPMLEAMQPLQAAATRKPGATSKHPLRSAFVYVPNGVTLELWTPSQTGSRFNLPYILQPLENFRKDIQVLSGLTHDKARANGDGPGDHARANSTFLTGMQARKTAGADIRIGVSIDQVVARFMGSQTRFPSLVMSCDKGRQSGSCDSGYSCAYQYSISWKGPSTPMPPEINPRLVFERLFAAGPQREKKETMEKRQAYDKSILDFVMEDTKRLQTRLGASDRQKLDEYLDSIRELEKRISSDEQRHRLPASFKKPSGIPDNFQDHIRVMMDLMVLAFQTDSTRIASFMIAHDGSNRAYPMIQVPEGHHSLSHHRNDQEKKQKIARINRFHCLQFAYLLYRLKSIREGEGTLLDHCQIVYGSGISDGNRHNNENLPIILAGGGLGTIRTGVHVRHPVETPMCNLFLSMMDRHGLRLPRFGDSTGRLRLA